MNTIALIVAAGRGTRASANTSLLSSGTIQKTSDDLSSHIPKQYQMLNGAMALSYSLNVFIRHKDVQAIQVIIRPEDLKLFNSLMRQFRGRTEKIYPPIGGGATRQKSVWRGLEILNGHLAPIDSEFSDADTTIKYRSRSINSPDRVLIHDAARPFVDLDLINRILEGLERANAVIPGIPIADTLKMVRNKKVVDTVSRDNLYQIQTPQGFNFSDLYQAHLAVSDSQEEVFTDDGTIMEQAGHNITVVEGSPNNWKITTPDDLIRASQQLADKREDVMISTRVGSGFDVHQFAGRSEKSSNADLANSQLVLCGVSIPHERPLSGHSDADVGLHALTDAILGAISDGDIGTHFPPSDPRWKGKPSDIFLADARDRVLQRGGRIEHVDVTLICERPKISPHRRKMCSRIAEILDIELDRVSVKATTTEGLGFTGRREGIAAMASATITV